MWSKDKGSSMTPEQINRALAKWLGWQPGPGCTLYQNSAGQLLPMSTTPEISTSAIPYFDPYHRIDHAWMVVERISEPPRTAEQARAAHNTKFMLWWNNNNLWTYTAPEVARAICEAVLEICEVEV